MVQPRGDHILCASVSAREPRIGAWIVLEVVIIYVPDLTGALGNPAVAVKIEGLNYLVKVPETVQLLESRKVPFGHVAQMDRAVAS